MNVHNGGQDAPTTVKIYLSHRLLLVLTVHGYGRSTQALSSLARFHLPTATFIAVSHLEERIRVAEAPGRLLLFALTFRDDPWKQPVRPKITLEMNLCAHQCWLIRRHSSLRLVTFTPSVVRSRGLRHFVADMDWNFAPRRKV